MTDLRNEQGKLIGGPTLAEIEARLAVIHTEPAGRHTLLARAACVGNSALEHLLVDAKPSVETPAIHIGALVLPIHAPDTQLNDYIREP